MRTKKRFSYFKSYANGFTLIEVMISLSILGFLSIFTAQAIKNALHSKVKIQKDIDKNSTLRDALRVMERDINMAFNYRDPNIKLHNIAADEVNKKRNPPVDPAITGVPPQQQAAAPLTGTPINKKTEIIFTQFVGDKEALSLTTLSNIRMTEDSMVSSQAEVGYRLKSCRRRSTQEQASKCLWRRVSDFIHRDITKHGEETVLLENVEEFKLRYLPTTQAGDWVDTYKTAEGADDATRGVFPLAVEITIAIRDPDAKSKDKLLRMTTVASIRNPNNLRQNQPPLGPGNPTGAPAGTPQPAPQPNPAGRP